MPRWDAWLAGLADVLGPLLLTVPPNLGSHKPSDLSRDPEAGLASPQPERAHDRRRDPADDHVDRRPARRLVRVAAGQGRARGQRRDRHLGRALRAGHRLRDGAPLHRRRRRRSPGQLGLPGGRHGRGRRRDRRRRPRERRRDPHRRQGPAHPDQQRPGARRRTRQRPAAHRQGRRHLAAPAHRVPGPRGPGQPARRLRRRHRALEDPQRRGQDQPGPGRTPRLHRRPRHQPARAPHRARWRWPRPCPTSSRPSQTLGTAGPRPGRSPTA